QSSPTQAKHNLREASVKKNAVTRLTDVLIQQTPVLQASTRRYRTFRIVIAARCRRFARMRACSIVSSVTRSGEAARHATGRPIAQKLLLNRDVQCPSVGTIFCS